MVLVINECIKIFRKKITIIFFIIALISLFVSYESTMYQMEENSKTAQYEPSITYSKLRYDNYKEQYKSAVGEKKDSLAIKIEIYDFAFKNDIYLNDSFSNYKKTLINKLEYEMKFLNKIDKSSNEYIKQENKINRIKRIVEENDFKDYISYQKEEIEEAYKNKKITFDEYTNNIKEQNDDLKYMFSFNYINYTPWQKGMLNKNVITLKDRVDTINKEYITNDKLEYLENEKKIALFRLENNIPPLNEKIYSNMLVTSYYGDNVNSYYRYNYDFLSVPVSMFIITLLFIILASSTISEEISKGTIKFLVVTPFKRYKIIFAKIISLIISLIVITLIISQINYLLGNIFFSNAPNEYLYVQNGIVKIMNTNIYETFNFLLKVPEIFIYILLAMTISTLTKSSVIANMITVIVYFSSTFVMLVNMYFSEGIFSNILKLDFVKYMPITNFNLIDKILPTYVDKTDFIIINTSLEFSLIVLGITAFLLIFTMLESFNKKDI